MSDCCLLSLVTVNTGIVNHTHSRMGSIMSTGIVQGKSIVAEPLQSVSNEDKQVRSALLFPPPAGATTGQSGPSSSGTYYPVTNQFTMGGAAISMASPMVVPGNTMHYGS